MKESHQCPSADLGLPLLTLDSLLELLGAHLEVLRMLLPPSQVDLAALRQACCRPNYCSW